MKRSGRCVLVAVLPLLPMQTMATADNDSMPKPQVRHLDNTAPKQILFVGNSYLYYNDSLHNHVRRIAVENGPHAEEDYGYKSATIGGARLSHHPIDTLLQPGRLGIEQPFDLVILQGGSASVLSKRRRTEFPKIAAELHSKISASGAETALYMIHAYVEPHPRFDKKMNERIARQYISTGNAIGALVIPVGLAFKKAYARRPDMQLHKAFDGTHPSLAGTYLAACVVYASIYEKPVRDIEYDYFGAVDAEDAAFLRTIADETVREFYGRQ